MDKLKNTKRNIIYGSINKIIMLLCPFIIRSIIIKKLGMDYVGLGSLFTSILQVLSLAELGFGSAIVYSMYKPIAEEDNKTLSALIYFYRRIYRIIGSIILVAGIAVMPLLKYIISGKYPADINIYILYLIYLVNTVASYFMYAYKQSILMAYQRNDVDSNISSIVNMVMYGLQIAALLLTRNYYTYIIFMPVATMAINVYRNYMVNKMYPHIGCEGEISRDVKKDMYKRVFGLMLTKVCQVCRNSFDSIVISAFLGLTILGRYQNYYYVISTLIGFLSIISNSIVAGIGNNIVTKSVEENYKQYNVFTCAYNWLASWCTVCLLCLYQPFMNIWIGKKNMFPFVLVILMCIYFYSMKAGDPAAIYKAATGIYWEDRARPVVESIANLGLNIILVKTFGVYGVVVSTIISIVFINIPWSMHVVFKIYFERKPFRNYMIMLINFVKLCITGAITYFLCTLINLDNVYISFILRVIICIVVPNVIIIVLNFKNEDFKLSVKLLKKMTGTRK